MGKKYLVLGGFGFIGSCVANTLCKSGFSVRILDSTDGKHIAIDDAIEVISGDICNKDVLIKAMDSVDTVLYFISHTFPSMNHKSMQIEIDSTLKVLDNTLTIMREIGVTKIVFPSSGGTIYGESTVPMANENHTLSPVSAYGMGKLLSEEIISYFCRVYGFSALILRISNVYGVPFYRAVQQGVVDIFIQKALRDEPIELWGDPSVVVRDYLFIDDLCSAIMKLINLQLEGDNVFNVASGVGYTLENVIDCIETAIGSTIQKSVNPNGFSGVEKSILDIAKIMSLTSWTPQYSLETGIEKTINRKLEIAT